MDVHRSRFVAYPVEPITALAFSRTNDNGRQTGLPQPALKLAIGRNDGAIELWNPQRGNWVQETVFPGDGKSIDGLVWTREPDEKDADGHVSLGQHRLFSIASSPTITEWNLESGCPERHSTGNFSEVWCFAAQPRQSQLEGKQEELQSQDLVAGCGDGTLVLISTADNDLQFKRYLARVPGRKAKCVSIAWQDANRVLAGFMDSTIRVFDTRNGTSIRTMSLGVGLPQAPKNAIVWQLKCLPNGDIVSGDSNGEVVFWDGRSYSLSQRIRGHPSSECLDLVTSADGQTVVSGGNDGRLAVYRQTTSSTGRKSWAKSHHRKTHDGQVKAMTVFDSKGLSVVVSGGQDLVPIVTPLREYGRESSLQLPALPQASAVRSSRHGRLLVSWWEKSISIWRFARKSATDKSPDRQPPRKLVARLELDVKTSIKNVAISDDGRVLAASTMSEVKMFQLRRRPESDSLGIRRLAVPNVLVGSGARLLEFSPDSRWIAVVNVENEVQVARLAAIPSKPKHVQVINRVVELERRSRLGTTKSAFSRFDRVISQLAFASDSSVLAVGDISGYLDAWVLEGREDLTAPAVDVTKDDSKRDGSDERSDDSDSSDDDDELCIFYGQHWADSPGGQLPSVEATPLVLSFRPIAESKHNMVNGNPGVHRTRSNPHAHSHELPRGPYRLWVMTAPHEMYEFDVLAGRLSDWSRRNPTSVLPEDFLKLKDRVKGAVWDVTPSRERIWLYGATWLMMLNVGSDLTPPALKKKRKVEEDLQDAKRQKTVASSGAGPKLISSHREGLPESLKRYEDGSWTDVNLDQATKATTGGGDVEDQEEEDYADGDAGLQLARLKSVDEEGEPSSSAVSASHGPQARRWWTTFKYRSILGVVPLADDAQVDEDEPAEMVIVERPLWDVKK
ncbi:U3 small nucleolar RNA-associated 4 [Lecanosticta acicola]|uniref:U3 small nucleolar RNA-associated 4 n=1 Tax=Lecanosticta acicola TaxID=111012 RepID=A0AAI8Z080_9PEZI|nr:U3 small nucleolar RNA-associated 4 [Lecanosticta acicola]